MELVIYTPISGRPVTVPTGQSQCLTASASIKSDAVLQQMNWSPDGISMSKHSRYTARYYYVL